MSNAGVPDFLQKILDQKRVEEEAARKQAEWNLDHRPAPKPTDLSMKYWQFVKYDENNVKHRLSRYKFKTDAGMVVAIQLAYAAEEMINAYWAKTGKYPPNVGEVGKRPARDFVVYVPTEEQATKARLLAVIEMQKQDLLSGKIGAAQQIKSIVESIQQIKKPNPFEPKAGDLVTKKMSAYQKKKLTWLWPNRVPLGTLTTVAGEPDQGKSLVTLDIAARVTTGTPFYGETESNPAADVLLLSAEDDPETTLAPRLAAVGADLDRITLIESVILTTGAGMTLTDRAAQLDQDLQKIEQVLEHNKEIRLIIIDPISSFLGGVSMVKEQDVRRVLGPLAQLCRKRKLAVILVAHFNKNSETRSAIDRVGGAKAIVGLGRAAWTCVREPKMEGNGDQQGVELADPERRLFLKLKGNLTPTSVGGLVYTIRTRQVMVEGDNGPEAVDIPHIVWLEKTESTAQDVVIDQQHRPTMQPSKVMDARTWLKQYLREHGGAAWSKDIFKDGDEYGHTVRTLQRALSSLANYRVVRSAGGLTQWLEPDAKELAPTDLPSKRKKVNTVTLETELPCRDPELARQGAE